MVRYFKHVFAVAALSLAAVAPAHALLLNPGDEVIFNFDFSGASPPPPYSVVGEPFSVTTFTSPTKVLLDTFDGLDATGSDLGPTTITLGSVGSFVINFASNNPVVIDGIFSIKFTELQNSLEVITDVALADKTGDGTARVLPTISGVPEPATLALLGIGLAGLGFSRRQRRQ